MRAPITDKHLLEMMWERFPEIMKRGTEPPAPVQPADWADAHGTYQGRGVISNAEMPAPAQQEPVAWLVYENWRKHSLFFTKEGAEDFKNASQRNDDLSGNLARWKTEPLYTSPPAQRTWVGLTDEELRKLCEEFWLYPRKLLQAIEAKLKEKNT